VFKERKFLLASSTWPGGIPDEVAKFGDEPAGAAKGVVPTPVGQGIEHAVPVSITGRDSYDRWEAANVVRGVAKGTVSAYAWARLGDITSAQFRALAAIQREFGADVRVTNRQNLVFRGLDDARLPRLHERLEALGIEKVQISLYSHKPEVHDAITKLPNSFRRTVEGARLLSEAGIKVKFANVLTAPNPAAHKRAQERGGKAGRGGHNGAADSRGDKGIRHMHGFDRSIPPK